MVYGIKKFAQNKMVKKFKNIIFDFDGVIGNTIEEIVNIVIGFYEEFRHQKANPKDIQKFIGKGIMQVIKELKVPITKIPYFEKKVRKELVLRIDNIKIFDGINEVLQQIKKEGYGLGILSSNSTENIRHILKKNNLDFFDFIYSGSSFFGKGKILAKLLKRYHLEAKQTLYIGDELRDIQAAKENKISSLAVGWGYNKENLLKAEKPDYFVKKPKDILKIIA